MSGSVADDMPVSKGEMGALHGMGKCAISGMGTNVL